MDIDSLFDKHGLLLLTGKSINIQGQEGYAMLSVQVVSGTVSVTGAAGLTIGGEACGAVSLSSGNVFTFGTGVSSIDDLTIDATSGSAIVVGVKVANPI